MRFNHKRELRQFKAEWDKQAHILREHGMNEDDISALFQYDFIEFKANRNYYLNKEEFINCETEAEYIHSHAKDKTALIEAGEHINALDAIDQIDNPVLLELLQSLKKSDLDLLIMAEIQGLTDIVIARELGQTRSNVTQKLIRIRKFLKNNFPKV